jgi:hypothetical protein
MARTFELHIEPLMTLYIERKKEENHILGV